MFKIIQPDLVETRIATYNQLLTDLAIRDNILPPDYAIEQALETFAEYNWILPKDNTYFSCAKVFLTNMPNSYYLSDPRTPNNFSLFHQYNLRELETLACRKRDYVRIGELLQEFSRIVGNLRKAVLIPNPATHYNTSSPTFHNTHAFKKYLGFFHSRSVIDSWLSDVAVYPIAQEGTNFAKLSDRLDDTITTLGAKLNYRWLDIVKELFQLGVYPFYSHSAIYHKEYPHTDLRRTTMAILF
jgi:hypothetical protein